MVSWFIRYGLKDIYIYIIIELSGMFASNQCMVKRSSSPGRKDTEFVGHRHGARHVPFKTWHI